MIKRMILFSIIIIGFYNFSNLTYAVNSDPAIQAVTDKAIEAHNKKVAAADKKAADKKAADKKAADKKAAEDKHNKDCLTGDKQGQCIDKANFEIKVDTISPGMKIHEGSTSETINFALGTIIQKLMIGLGSLSLLIMTIGGGYIVLHNGQDELLNKGKSIFMSGIYAMLVALSSYYLIVIVRWILYA